MIKIENNKLLLSDGTYYDLKTTTFKRVMQGLDSQLQEGSLTQKEYNQCIELLNAQKLTIKRVRLLEDFKSFIKSPKDHIDEMVNSNYSKAISYLESLSMEILSEVEIDKTFDIAAGRI